LERSLWWQNVVARAVHLPLTSASGIDSAGSEPG
jgi:hypothetical protein